MGDLDASQFDAAGRLLADAYPHRAHEVRTWNRPAAQERPRRWAAVLDSVPTLAGYAAIWHVERGKYRVDVIVDRACRRRGIGARLLDVAIDEATRAEAVTVQARAYADCPEALAFLHRRGFVETMRMHGAWLDLARVDERLLSEHAREGDGVAIAAVSDADVNDERFWRRMCDLQSAAREGWPDPDPGGPMETVSESDMRRMLLAGGALPLAFFVARRGEELVGYSAVAALGPGSEAQFAATAVRPDMRGRGIATALRARGLLSAKTAGVRTVRSSSGNPWLLRINARFGFVPAYCEVRLVKPTRGEAR